jgi:hypothetical protein
MKSRSVVLPVALSAEEVEFLDDWIASRPDPKPSRPEAIRHLMICAMVDHPGQ